MEIGVCRSAPTMKMDEQTTVVGFASLCARAQCPCFVNLFTNDDKLTADG